MLAIRIISTIITSILLLLLLTLSYVSYSNEEYKQLRPFLLGLILATSFQIVAVWVI